MARYDTVVSADGTTIGYRESGDGPGVALIHGGLQAAQNLSRLAAALSGAFRVYVPDRRGRGRSGPFGPEYGLAREAEDVDALLKKTGARRVFGLSSGALVALYAAQTLPGIEKLAVYEPPLSVGGVDPAAWAPRYERDMERGDLAAAMVTAIQGTGDIGPMRYTPRALLVPLMRLAIRADAEKSARAGRVALRDLIPTVHYDAQLQRESRRIVGALAAIRCTVLLLGGDRSHRALRAVLDELALLLPHAQLARLAGVGHVAADDVGRPKEVASRLKDFFRDEPGQG
jgi:pimeloyl-ACP methyl ester carboxylesterase